MPLAFFREKPSPDYIVYREPLGVLFIVAYKSSLVTLLHFSMLFSRAIYGFACKARERIILSTSNQEHTAYSLVHHAVSPSIVTCVHHARARVSD